MAAAGQKLVSLHVSVPRRSKNGRGMTERNKMANMSAGSTQEKVTEERAKANGQRKSRESRRYGVRTIALYKVGSSAKFTRLNETLKIRV